MSQEDGGERPGGKLLSIVERLPTDDNVTRLALALMQAMTDAELTHQPTPVEYLTAIALVSRAVRIHWEEHGVSAKERAVLLHEAAARMNQYDVRFGSRKDG